MRRISTKTAPRQPLDLPIKSEGLYIFKTHMSGTFSITTFGCQMNKSDSERLTRLLTSCGLVEIDGERGADVIVLNTCSVRQTAEDRVYGMAKKLKQEKERNPDCIVALTGCMAGRDHDGAIRSRLPGVDLFFPTSEMIFLPRRLSELRPDLIDQESGDTNEYDHYLKIKPAYTSRASAYVAISNGCNKFCTYCVVPYARGRQKDRDAHDVIEEVLNLARLGYKEITLLGQTVNLYRPRDCGVFSDKNPFDRSKNCFPALLWELNQIEMIERIHFTAPHPEYMDDDVIAALALPKLLNYLHLPVQSGSNEVLKRMNRPYTREYYIERIERIRAGKPDIALGTDIIVGFSGETEAQFEETLDLYRTCDFDIAYIGKYSVRSGTVAAKRFADDVPKMEKKIRWRVLQDLMESTVYRKNQRFVGRIVSVLVDSVEKGIASGNSLDMKRVQFCGSDDLVGSVVPVQIDRAIEWILYGSRTS